MEDADIQVAVILFDLFLIKSIIFPPGLYSISKRFRHVGHDALVLSHSRTQDSWKR